MKRAPVTIVLIMIVMLGLGACAANAKAPAKAKISAEDAAKAKAQSEAQNKAAEQVRTQVNNYKPNIIELYQKHAKDNDMKGLVSVTLYLAEDGTVAMCDVTPKRGNLSNTFLLALEKMINQWTFTDARKIAYSFMLTLE